MILLTYQIDRGLTVEGWSVCYDLQIKHPSQLSINLTYTINDSGLNIEKQTIRAIYYYALNGEIRLFNFVGEAYI